MTAPDRLDRDTAAERPRKRSAARARRALGWGLVLFVLSQLGVRVGLEADPTIVEPEFGRKLSDLRAALVANPGAPLILMLGSSRVATGFRPDHLPPLPAIAGRTPVAYNFAMVGTGPELTHLLLHRILAAGIRPAWVFVEYWPPFWFTERTLKDYQSQVNVGRLDLEAARLLAGYSRRSGSIYSTWMTAQLAPIYVNRAALLKRFAPAWAPREGIVSRPTENLDPLGWWNPRATRHPDYDRQVRTRMLAHYTPILAKSRTRPMPDLALNSILTLCRREQIRFSLIVLPEGERFRRCYTAQATEVVDTYLDRIRREHNVDVVDARGWVDESDFIDSHHLFPEGAAQFTRRLGVELAAPQIAAHQRASTYGVSGRSRMGKPP